MSKVGKRILVGSLVAAFLCGALMFGVSSYIVNDMAKRAWNYEATNAVNKGLKKYNGDLKTTIKARSQYILEEEGREYKSRLTVYDKRGDSVADNFGTSSKKSEPDKVLKDILLGDRASFIKMDGNEIRTIIPIKNNNVVIGALERYYNIEPILKVRDTNIIYLFMFSIISALLGGFLGLLINKNMIENVENLKRSAIKIGESELAIMEKSIDVKGNKKRRNEKKEKEKEAKDKSEDIKAKEKDDTKDAKIEGKLQEEKGVREAKEAEEAKESKGIQEFKGTDIKKEGDKEQKSLESKEKDEAITPSMDESDKMKSMKASGSESLEIPQKKEENEVADKSKMDRKTEEVSVEKNQTDTEKASGNGAFIRNRFMFSTVEVNVVDLLYEIGEMYASKTYEKGIDFIFETENENILIEADINSMRQALMNIVDNAVKFSFRGGLINIEILDISSGAVEIKIRDNGVGISEEDMDKIFTEHYSAGENAGMGLGLTYSKEIINGHGGDIHVNSIEGEGTEVVIKLKKTWRNLSKDEIEKWGDRNEKEEIGENNNVAKTSNETELNATNRDVSPPIEDGKKDDVQEDSRE